MLDRIFAAATAREDDPGPAPESLLLFAHPDDETLALGARFRRFHSATLVHVTDGAPRNGLDALAHGFATLDDYRAGRRRELREALCCAGFGGTSITLDIPDQEAAFNLATLIRAFCNLLNTHRPEVVFTHPYEGGHPDHDACAFAASRALALYAEKNGAAPLLIEAAFYHAAPQGIETGTFLPNSQETPVAQYALSPRERQIKRAMLACFATQRETLNLFSTEFESFRIAPRYDFSRPPHEGQLFYERFPWGMTANHFCDLTRQAEPVCA